MISGWDKLSIAWAYMLGIFTLAVLYNRDALAFGLLLSSIFAFTYCTMNWSVNRGIEKIYS